MLVGLTVVTGVVDAVSILALGRVFVANMTGNVVFVGFALAGAAGFSLAASLFGLVGFLLGAGVGGRMVTRFGEDRARVLAVAVTVELLLVALATVVVGLSDPPTDVAGRDLAVVVLALATGIQNAVVRRLAVPDLTTTVLTMTLTGIAADIRGGARTPAFARRVLAVAAMLAGAAGGAALVLHRSPSAALGVGSALLALLTITAWRATRLPGAWRAADTTSPAAPSAPPEVHEPARTAQSRSWSEHL